MAEQKNNAVKEKVIFSFFSGSGFLDLGFELNGFNINLVNEFQPSFMAAYQYSREKMGLRKPSHGYYNIDINDFLDKRKNELHSYVDEERAHGNLVGFIGGPPCPDFSIAGKNKGRDGDNGKLSQSYISLIIEMQPDFFLFENVKGLWKTARHRQFFEELKNKLHGAGYVTTERLTNALEFGAPQDRDRILMFGIKGSLLRNEDQIADFPWAAYRQYNVNEIKSLPWPETDAFVKESVTNCPPGVLEHFTVEYWFRKNDVEHNRSSDEAPTMKDSTVILKPNDVLHIPGLGFDGLVGYSPIAMAKNAIGMAIACEEYGAKFFANGAAPGGVLEHPGTIKDPTKVREAWQSQFGGSGNSNKIAVLEEGMKYTPIGISPEQAQFLETRKFQINEIARIFRVPPHMVGDLEKSSFSNIEQQSLEFVKYTLDPWVIRWEQSIMRTLLSQEEKTQYFVKFNLEGLLRGDYQSRMTGYATARQNGWMSANDIRELENLDRIPTEDGGDLYLINGNMLPLANAGAFADTTSTDNGKEETDNDQSEEVLALEKRSRRRAGNGAGA